MINIDGYRIRKNEILYYHGMKQGFDNPRYFTRIYFKNNGSIDVDITAGEMDELLGII